MQFEILKNMKTIIYLSFTFAILFTACSSSSGIKYTIASQCADCMGGAGPQKCLLVKKGNATEWEFFYSNIEGFQYQPGYEYTLEVKEEKIENAPADVSSIKYILVKEISKIQKESSNLPLSAIHSAPKYQCVGKVLAIETESVGTKGAAGKFVTKIVKIEVTSSNNSEIPVGEIIYCELIPSPQVQPVIGNEYVFKAKNIHPAHAKGIYTLDTDVVDLIR